jgi:putative FmdB family regulatory protein
MPTYEYACKSCGERTEAVQAFSDPPLTECPHCGGTLRKVFGTPAIVLKGSGFYKTDSRSSSNGKRSDQAAKSSSGASDKGEGGTKSSGDKSESGGSSSSESSSASTPSKSSTPAASTA